ncbi:MAG TPA: PAS domain S-box protein [Bacteroidales bacterium]|nr:PAS domain S-box protein [Bacteroidales bacterium]
MNSLDIKTIVFINLVTDLICVFFIADLWTQSRRRYKGMLYFMADLILQTLAIGLIFLRGTIPDWTSMVLSNFFVTSGALIGYMGLQRLGGKPGKHFYNYILLGLSVCIQFYFAVINPNLDARNLNITIVLFIITFQCTWFVFRVSTGSRRRALTGTGLVFAAFSLISILRVFNVLTGESDVTDFFRSGSFDAFILISYQILLIILAYALSLAVNRMLLMEVSAQEEKFSKAFNSAPYAVILTRISDGKIIEVNEGFTELSGYQRDEVLNVSTLSLGLWYDSSDRIAAINTIREMREVRNQEFRFRKKNGEILTGLFSADVITLEDGPSLLSSIFDITSRKIIEEEQKQLLVKGERDRKALLSILEDFKKAQDSLSESEMRYRSLFESTNVGKSVTLPDGSINVNNAFCRMLGYSSQELKNKKWQELTPAEDVAYVSDILSLILNGQRNNARFEKRYIHKNGTHIWGDVSTVLLRDKEGNPGYFITTVVDITDKKKAETELSISERRYRSLFENMNSGFVLFQVVRDKEGDASDLIILAANRGFESTTGLDLKNAIGKKLKSILPGIEKDEADWIGTYSKVAQTGEPVQFEQNSALLGVSYSVSAFKADTDQCAVTFVDITARKQAEKALLDSEMRYRSILELAPVGISIHQKGKIVFTNPAGMRLVGAGSIEEVIGKDATIFIHPESIEASLNRYKRLMQGEKDIYPIEDRHIRIDGSIIDVEVVATSLIFNNEPAVQVIITDITEKKRIREELRRMNADLEDTVRKRTAQLEESNKELEAFSYSVSHDLRAPLRHINGYVDLLNDKFKNTLPEKAKHYLDVIAGSAKNMGILIDDLLQFSRESRKELRRENVDMNALVNEILLLQTNNVGKRKIEWTVAEIPAVNGDYSMLKLVWRNLMENAIKYTSTRNVATIEIGYSENDDEISYYIKDNGVGFDMKYAHKLFGVFQRLHSQAEFEGNGIGLANVKRIVSKHGGNVWAEAIPDKGATFIFSIPKHNKE